MSLCKVHYIDVIPEACSVLGRIIIAEDAQTLTLADCGLRDERNQIVRNSARKLTDEGRRMRTDRVEVTEGYSLDLALTVCSVEVPGCKDTFWQVCNG